MNCPSCGAPIQPGASFCDNCGAQLPQGGQTPPPSPAASSTKCPACGADNVPGSMFCDNCGAALNQPAAQPPQPPAAPVPPQWGQQPGPAMPPPGTPVPPGPAGQQPPQPQQQQWGQQPPQPQQPQWGPPPSIPGRFVIQTSGAVLPIPQGKSEIVIGREDPVSGIFPDIDLEAHDALNQGVSRSHSKLTVQGGQVYVEDLKTANYTNLRGQRLQPGQKYPLNNGDELILGRLRLVYYAS